MHKAERRLPHLGLEVVTRLAHAAQVGFALAGFIACVIAANLFIQHVGYAHAGGPHTFPIPGWQSVPSGTIFVGVSLTARDYLHEHAGILVTFLAILLGAALSWLVAPNLAIASGVTFAVAETADLVVYAPLRQRHKLVAVVVSNVVGAAVDSVLFLALAFDLAAVRRYALGQATVKLVMSLLFVAPILASFLSRAEGARVHEKSHGATRECSLEP